MLDKLIQNLSPNLSVNEISTTIKILKPWAESVNVIQVKKVNFADELAFKLIPIFIQIIESNNSNFPPLLPLMASVAGKFCRTTAKFVYTDSFLKFCVYIISFLKFPSDNDGFEKIHFRIIQFIKILIQKMGLERDGKWLNFFSQNILPLFSGYLLQFVSQLVPNRFKHSNKLICQSLELMSLLLENKLLIEMFEDPVFVQNFFIILHSKAKLSEIDTEDFTTNPDQFIYFNLECYRLFPGIIRPSCYVLIRSIRKLIGKENFMKILISIPIQDEFDFEASLFLFISCSKSDPIPSEFFQCLPQSKNIGIATFLFAFQRMKSHPKELLNFSAPYLKNESEVIRDCAMRCFYEYLNITKNLDSINISEFIELFLNICGNSYDRYPGLIFQLLSTRFIDAILPYAEIVLNKLFEAWKIFSAEEATIDNTPTGDIDTADVANQLLKATMTLIENISDQTFLQQLSESVFPFVISCFGSGYNGSSINQLFDLCTALLEKNVSILNLFPLIQLLHSITSINSDFLYSDESFIPMFCHMMKYPIIFQEEYQPILNCIIEICDRVLQLEEESQIATVYGFFCCLVCFGGLPYLSLCNRCFHTFEKNDISQIRVAAIFLLTSAAEISGGNFLGQLPEIIIREWISCSTDDFFQSETQIIVALHGLYWLFSFGIPEVKTNILLLLNNYEQCLNQTNPEETFQEEELSADSFCDEDPIDEFPDIIPKTIDLPIFSKSIIQLIQTVLQ